MLVTMRPLVSNADTVTISPRNVPEQVWDHDPVSVVVNTALVAVSKVISSNKTPVLNVVEENVVDEKVGVAGVPVLNVVGENVVGENVSAIIVAFHRKSQPPQ